MPVQQITREALMTINDAKQMTRSAKLANTAKQANKATAKREANDNQ
jgi:hypothetical protein